MSRAALLRMLLPARKDVQYFLAFKPRVKPFMRQYGHPTVESLDDATERNLQKGDIYIATAGFNPHSKRRTKKEVIDKWVISADVDDKKMPGVKETQHANARSLTQQVPVPCMIVDTGGGYHVHIPVPAEMRIAAYERQSVGVRAMEVMERALVYYLEDRSRALFGSPVHLDHAIGVERLWRMPYSKNFKYGLTVTPWVVNGVIADPETNGYPPWIDPIPNLSFLSPYLEIAKRDHDTAGARADVDLDTLGDLPAFEIEHLPVHLRTQWPMDTPDADHSALDYKVVAALIEQGFADDRFLASAIVARRNELTDPGARAKGARKGYVMGTIKNAKARTFAPVTFDWTTDAAPDPEPAPKPTDKAVDWKSWEYRELFSDLRRPYAPVLPEDHFVTEYVRMVAERTDAAYCFQEALAFVLLAVATPGLEIKMKYAPVALGTNLYMILLGESGVSRKSTSLDHARQILLAQNDIDNPYPGFIAARTTPERLIQRLAQIRKNSALWQLDELQALISDTRRSYMTALRGLVLELYAKRDYAYERTSGKDEDGNTVENVSRIQDCYLNIMTAATGAIYSDLFKRDVQDGFLPRFIVVSDKDMPRPRSQTGEQDEEDLNRLIYLAKRWRDIYRWALGALWVDVDDDAKREAPRVRVSDAALAQLDRFGNWVEHRTFNTPDSIARTMTNRAMDTATKLSVLVRVGRRDGILAPSIHPGADPEPASVVYVTEEDAYFGCEFAHRWVESAMQFGEGFHETAVSADLAFITGVIQRHPGIGLTDLRRQLKKLPRFRQDDLIQQLLEADDIHVKLAKTAGRPIKRHYAGPAPKEPKSKAKRKERA